MIRSVGFFALVSLFAVVRGQQIGTNTAEVHPVLPWQSCTGTGASATCTTQSSGQVVLDSNWRWVHDVGGTTNCYTGNAWNTTLCPDGLTCAQNCALDGAAYSSTYGITTSGSELRLNFVTDSSNVNVGSRVYLMASNTEYEMFMMLNHEITFDVNVANLPCGLNGAVYFSEMAADGGLSAYPSNKAGAQYGTGYCDSQCPRDIKFINGEANCVGWTPSSNNSNAGTGMYGTCCSEMDLWEANSMAAAVTPHPCTVTGQTQCSGTQCGAASGSRYSGVCDPDGCDWNSFRMGNENFLGPGLTVDTTKPFTVVTQFLTNDGTNTGTLSQINRFYVQNNVTIANSFANTPGVSSSYNYISDAFCTAQKTAFNNTDSFAAQGGMAGMGAALGRGVVLVLSLWDDYAVDMLWLDSDYPATANPATPGVARGNCSTTSGSPPTVESQNANAYVTYSNIKYGTINSTFIPPTGGSSPPPSSPPPSSPPPSSPPPSSPPPSSHTTTTTTTKTTTTPASGPTQTHWGQCGGIGYTGPTVCTSGTTCQELNPYYSQCL